MKNFRKLLCLAGWLLSPFVGIGQSAPPTYSILVSARASISGSDFRVELTRYADSVHLRYGRLDSVQHTLFRQNPLFTAYVSALENGPLASEERTNIARQIMDLEKQYKVYRWDSLRVATSNHQPFLQMLDSVYVSSAAQLQRAAANRNRIVLDGNVVHVVVKGGNQTEKDLYVQSPGRASHPQLYRLLHEALQLYRQKQPAAFLDQGYTGGY